MISEYTCMDCNCRFILDKYNSYMLILCVDCLLNRLVKSVNYESVFTLYNRNSKPVYCTCKFIDDFISICKERYPNKENIAYYIKNKVVAMVL